MTDDKYQNGSVEKAFLILEALAGRNEPMSLVRLVSETGINKTTLFRFISVLCKLGYVWKSPDGSGYSIGMRFIQLGTSAHVSSALATAVRPYLVELAAIVQESIHLGLLEGDKVFYCDKVESDHSLRMITQTGISLEAYCTGIGKAMLSRLSPKDVGRLYHNRNLAARTPHTITSLDTLQVALEDIRVTGYALDNEEFETGLRCVAVPLTVTVANRNVALSVSGPAFRMTDQAIEAIVPELLKTAAKACKMLERSTG